MTRSVSTRSYFVMVGLLVVGCGRLDFAPLSPFDAPPADGATAGDGAPGCDPTMPFGAPVAISELDDALSSDGTLRLLPDELSGYFYSGRAGGTGNNDIYLVSRPTRSAPFTIQSIVGINTVGDELDLTPSSDGTVAVYQSNLKLYVATRTGPDSFVGATSIVSLTSGSGEKEAFLQPDGAELYFVSLRTGNEELYRSIRSGTTFSAPVRITELSTPSREGDPVITADGLTLYFRSDRPAAFASFNIYVAMRATLSDPFGPAVLVPNVNGPGADGASWLSPDGCRLYLTSDRAGTSDIYVATRGS
jgi:Tol biopolymer transport system component